MVHRFGLAEWAILASYILAVTVLGSLFYHKRSSASEFFLGSRKMRALPVAISLVAADLSAVSYMGAPAWSFKFNLELLWSTLGYVLVVPVVMYLFLPLYMRLKLYTGYEYLERRFDLKTRLVASGLFLILRGSHVAIAIYAPALVLSILTGLPLYATVLITGVFTTIYTTLGGIRGVIWTDAMQFSILMGGVMAVFWLALSRIPGGIGTVYTVAKHAGRLHFFNFSFDPRELTAFWPAFFGGAVLILATMGTDQAYMQRYFTTSSLREGRRSLVLDIIIVIPLTVTLFLLGDVLFVFYHFHPARLDMLPQNDAILPYFVLHELGGVFSGLVIASIFASSMAVMSAGVNSLTTATTVDFYRRWLRPRLQEGHYVSVGRWGTVGWGVACTLGALFAGELGPLVNAAKRVNAIFGGPMLGIFLLGMVTRRAKGTPAIIGGAVATLVVSWLNWTSKVSFFYFALIGVVITFLMGYLLSLSGPGPELDRLAGLVIRVGNAPADTRDSREVRIGGGAQSGG